MNKLNKKYIICAWIIFIVLMLSNAFASSEELADTNQGTKDNPFILNINSGAGRSTTFKFTSFPFYFKAQTPGSYEVSIDSEKNEVMFMLVDNNVQSVIAVIDEDESQKADRKQLGVNYKEVDARLISNPKYEISELVFGKDGNFSETHQLRRLKLINIAPNASLLASRSNLYFFTNEDDNLVKKQLQELREKQLGVLGSWSYGYGNSSQATVDYIIYECNGYDNSALTSEPVDKNSIEAIVTRLFISVGDNFLLKGIRGVFGNSNISINTLIFNKFELTKLDLYDSTTSERTD